MLVGRRSFLAGAAAVLFAPAVVRADSLMRVAGVRVLPAKFAVGRFSALADPNCVARWTFQDPPAEVVPTPRPESLLDAWVLKHRGPGTPIGTGPMTFNYLSDDYSPTRDNTGVRDERHRVDHMRLAFPGAPTGGIWTPRGFLKSTELTHAGSETHRRWLAEGREGYA